MDIITYSIVLKNKCRYSFKLYSNYTFFVLSFDFFKINLIEIIPRTHIKFNFQTNKTGNTAHTSAYRVHISFNSLFSGIYHIGKAQTRRRGGHITGGAELRSKISIPSRNHKSPYRNNPVAAQKLVETRPA